MSREPRIQFEEDGTVVGEVWKDTNGDLVLEENESGEQAKLTSNGFDVDTLNAQRAHSSGEVTGNLVSKFYTTFSMEFLGQPFGGGYNDPLVFNGRHFSDGAHRVIVLNGDGDKQNKLYKTDDFSTFTLLDSDYLGTVSWGSGRQLQDNIVLSDGTFVLYDSEETSGSTNVWTGSSLDTVTELGTAVSDYGDCGVFYDEPNETVHIYPEGEPYQDTPCSDYIKHFTTPANDLLNTTQKSDAIDLSGVSWHTGDVEVIAYGDFYYMFMDMSYDHVPYEIALARSADLDNWTVTSQSIMSNLNDGGDLAVTKVGNVFYGFTEYTGGTVGMWKVHPHPVSGTIEAPGNRITFNTKDGGQVAEFITSNNGQNDFLFHAHPQESGRSQSLGMVYGNDDSMFRLGDAGPTPGLKWDAGSEFELKAINPGSALYVSSTIEMQPGGNPAWTAHDDQSVEATAQDLSSLSLGSAEDGRIYRHSGASSITADGGTTSSSGYYVWDNSTSEFKSMVQF